MRNRFELIGRIASVNNGENYVQFSVAEDQSYKKKDSEEWTEKVEFHPCVAFENVAKRFDSYLAKGDYGFKKLFSRRFFGSGRL